MKLHTLSEDSGIFAKRALVDVFLFRTEYHSSPYSNGAYISITRKVLRKTMTMN